jgi:molybdate transport system substrate-binding protein
VKPRRLLGLLVAILLAACSSPASSPSAAPPSEPAASSSVEPGAASDVPAADLTIFAASSLKNALVQAKVAYESANPGTTLTISTDSSAALETQIEQGAPADVFLSADAANPKKLVDGGFASGDAVPFAGNTLTIVVPTDNPGGVTSPMDLAKSGLKVISAGDEVPITKYAKQLVTNLAGLSGYPANFADSYAANVVSKEDNVKAVVAKIELGEGDAGIVYVTDAAASDKVKGVDVPDEANVAVTYEGVVVKASPNQAAATAFLEWLAGAEGRAILQQFGFLAPAS